MLILGCGPTAAKLPRLAALNQSADHPRLAIRYERRGAMHRAVLRLARALTCFDYLQRLQTPVRTAPIRCSA
jgi:hypothetical protein